MTTELEGKVGLVTGGTSGVGRDTAVLFAKAGAKVVVAGRRELEGEETVALIRATGGDCSHECICIDIERIGASQMILNRIGGRKIR